MDQPCGLHYPGLGMVYRQINDDLPLDRVLALRPSGRNRGGRYDDGANLAPAEVLTVRQPGNAE